MKVFDDYADYYDCLYQDKDYQADSDFLEEIFGRYSKEPTRKVLDLGCGTAGHCLVLAKRGYKITGIDLSSKMLRIAKRKAEDKKIEIDFVQGDIRNIDLNKTFDAAISMFAVISYQIRNKDLALTFESTFKHLRKNGLFIFDCWSGPAVLAQGPQDRLKIVKKEGQRIIRFAHPILNTLKHTVDVEYKVLRIFKDKILDELSEVHKMRFFFPQEIKYYLEKAGFKPLEICPFLRLNETPTEKDWNITVIAKKL